MKAGMIRVMSAYSLSDDVAGFFSGVDAVVSSFS